MRSKFALLLVLLGAGMAHAATPANDVPGYGVVQSVTRVQPPKAEPSASAGASAARKPAAQTYLVRVRLDDGSVQVRQVKNRAPRIGERVLVTNAGDVVPE